MLWAFALLCGASVILPTFVLIGSQADAYESSVAVASQKVADFQVAATMLVDASKQATLVINEDRQEQLSNYIDTFRSLEGDSIRLTGISVARDGVGIAPAVLDGVADDRQSLASFRDRLLAEPNVATVDLPISNLATDRNINFSLTVEISNEPSS